MTEMPEMTDISALPVGTMLCLEDEGLVKIAEMDGARGILRNPPASVNIYAPDFDLKDYFTPFDADPTRNVHICSHIKRPRV